MQTPDRGKSKALRIRMDYYRHTSAFDRAKRLLIILGLILSLAYGLWILIPTSGRGKSFAMLHVSAGPVAQVHAAFENDCEKCHAHGLSIPLGKNSFQFDPERRLEHQESACQNCHRVDGHWRTSLKDPSQDRDCARCHHEHTGRATTLTQVANQACAECHRNLQAVCSAGKQNSNALAIMNFSNMHGVVAANGKAQFRSLLTDRGRIKFDHAQHLQPGQVDAGRRGGMRLQMLPPTVRERLRQPGQSDTDLVALNCASCHQLHTLQPTRQHAVSNEEGRYYAPINFEMHCQACHQLTFPGQTGEMLPLPHVTSLKEYELLLNARKAASSVQSRSEQATPDSTTPSLSLGDVVGAKDQADLSLAMTMDSLMRRCQQCHLPEDTAPQAIERAMAGQMQPLIPSRWLASGYFDHAAHSRIENCQYCHEIPGSVDKDEPLLPSPPTDQEHVFIRGPESCSICHRPSDTTPSPVLADAASVQTMFGQSHQPTWASDDCTLCHRYHWTDPKPQGASPGFSHIDAKPKGASPGFSHIDAKPKGASPGFSQSPNALRYPSVRLVRFPSQTESHSTTEVASTSSSTREPGLATFGLGGRVQGPEPTLQTAQAWLGRAGCGTATCHGGIVDSAATWHASATIWEAGDPHAQAGSRLQGTLGRRIVTALEPAAESNASLFDQVLHRRCVACHAPESESSPAESDWSRRLLQGVGCESCHGAAGRWMDAHTRNDFNARDRSARALGMMDTKTLSGRIENCVRCHIGSRSADGLVRDVNHDLIAAGHPRMLFDPMVMQRKLPPHWDTRPGAAMSIAAAEIDDANQAARRVVLEYVERLKQERRSSPDPLPKPEFSEFDCRACHKPLTSKGGA